MLIRERGNKPRKSWSSKKKQKFIRIANPHLSLPAILHLFLLWKLLLPNITPPQLHIQHPLHGTQNLLIRIRRPALKVLHDRGRRVAFGRQLLLRHLVGLLVASLLDRVGDLCAYCLGLDDVFRSVDFGEMLAFDGGAGRLVYVSSFVTSPLLGWSLIRRQGGGGGGGC